jgi:magnesium transporter
LRQVVDDGKVVWIDLVHPVQNSVSLVADALGLGSLVVEDLLLPLRMPKFDLLPTQSAFVGAFAIRIDRESTPRLRAVGVSLVVSPSYLVTVSQVPVPEMTRRLEAALQSDGELPANSGPALAHAALDAIVDEHLPVTLQAAEAAEELEDALDPRAERRGLTALENLIVLRRDLLAFRRLAVAQQEVLRRVGRTFPAVQAQLADVADDQREAVETAVATCDYIDGAVEAFRVRRDAQAEDAIRRLSVLAGVLWPVSLFIGLWGINFPNIPGTDASWGWIAFVLVQIFVILAGSWFFRRRGLL